MNQPAVVVKQSVCPLDCPDTCSLDVTIEGGRVTQLDGNRTNPVTEGYICGKVRHFTEHLYGPERVLRPLIRTGGKGEGDFRAASWDEALTRVVDAIRGVRDRFGGESILPLCYGGSNGYLTQDTTDARLFFRLGASRLLRTVCAAPTATAVTGLYGRMPGVAYEDYPSANLIVVWGANPSATGIHLVPYIRRAQRAGAKLVVVDPRRTPLARVADMHLAVRPGADLPLALSVINWLFEKGRADAEFLAAHATGAEELRQRASAWTFEKAAEVTGIAGEDIERFAQLYTATTPALIRCGWGLERNRNGGSAVAAVLALPAVAGKFGVRGGGFTMSNSMAWDLTSLNAAGADAPDVRRVNMNVVGESLTGELDPPIKLLFVYNCNPLATLPQQEKVRAGLARDDLFTVVHEQVMTDTARYADVVLPATTFLEHTELKKAYGATLLQSARPVIEPVGEARPNYWLFAELCRRLDLSKPDDPEDADDVAQAILASDGGNGNGRIAREIAASGHAAPDCGPRPVQFVDVFPRAADGKINLVPPHLDREAPLGLYGYQPDPSTDAFPLALISPALSITISSTLAQLHREHVAVRMHPNDGARRGINNGETVRVFNEHGEVICPALLDDKVLSGVAVLPKGLWSTHTQNGRTANALAPDTLTDLGGGACFNDARVEIERWEQTAVK